MNIIAIISLVASVATILLIFFRIKNPKEITLQVFFGLLIIACVIIIVIYYIIDGRDSVSKLPAEDDSVINIPIIMDDVDDFDGQNPIVPVESADKPEDSDQPEELDKLEELDKPDRILNIDPIIDNAYSIMPIEDSLYEILPNEIVKIPGEIVSEKQIIEYEYTPSISGMHRFEFSDVPNGTDFALVIYNSGKERIVRYSDLDTGDGISQSLKAGELYYICVEQYRGVGTYVLNIGQKKEIFDISNYTAVSDSIQYTDQENDYLFMPQNSGAHRFEFSNVPNGTDLTLTLFNSGWERIVRYSDLDNYDGITYSLDAEEIYYIRVTQYREIGPYTLKIGHKKEIKNISDYNSVSDSIQYKDQVNSYSFTPELDGTHRFEFSNVPNGTDLKMRLLNSGWEELIRYSDLDNGDGITYHLTAGEKYYIKVEQYEGVGSYTLNIGKKKPTPDISSWSGVSDSIQYTDQRNDYLYTAKTDGVYYFTVSSLSEGNSFNLVIYNSGWEKLASGSSKSVEVSLSKDETYIIQVTPKEGSVGGYRLTVEY